MRDNRILSLVHSSKFNCDCTTCKLLDPGVEVICCACSTTIEPRVGNMWPSYVLATPIIHSILVVLARTAGKTVEQQEGHKLTTIKSKNRSLNIVT